MLFFLSLVTVKGSIRFPEQVVVVTGFIFLWITFFGQIFHALRQSGGVGLLINRSLAEHLSDEQRQNLSYFGVVERRLLSVVYAGTLGGLALRHFGQSWNLPYKPIMYLCSASAFVAAFYLLYLIQRSQLFTRTNKFAYSLRFVLWPFSLYSTVAVWFVILMHSTEYLALFRRIVRTQSAARSAAMTISVFLAAALVVGISKALGPLDQLEGLVTGTSFLTIRENLRDNLAATLFLTLYPMLTMGHFVVDGLIYRMHTPSVRENIGPAVTGFLNS